MHITLRALVIIHIGECMEYMSIWVFSIRRAVGNRTQRSRKQRSHIFICTIFFTAEAYLHIQHFGEFVQLPSSGNCNWNYAHFLFVFISVSVIMLEPRNIWLLNLYHTHYWNIIKIKFKYSEGSGFIRTSSLPVRYPDNNTWCVTCGLLLASGCTDCLHNVLKEYFRGTQTHTYIHTYHIIMFFPYSINTGSTVK
jgi:hypothetical protein